MWLQYIPFSNNIKKRIVRYLIQRFVGQFFEEKLRLDQMTIDLYNGTGSVSDVTLDVQVLNDLADLHNLPFEFVDGYISEMSVSIPWGSLLTDSSYVEVSGVVITVQPKQREESDVSTLESMWSSMSSSMQLAAECMKQSPPEPADRAPDSQGQQGQMEGLELFAQTIESILSRIKVKFINTLLRIEHLPKRSRTGVAVEISIKHMDYCDEARMSAETQGEPMSNPFSVNKFHFEGVSLYSDEFPSEARTFSRSLVIDNKSGDSDSNSGVNCDTKPIIIAKLGGRQEMRLTVKKGENVQGPKVDLEMNLGSLSVFLSPRQMHLLMELGHGFGAPDTQDDSNVSRCAQKPMEADDYDRVEQQLMTQLQPTPSRGLHSLQGWSSAPLEDSDEEFLPMRGDPKNLSDSTFSAATSLNASFSSSCSSYSKSITSMTSSNPANSGQQGKKKQKEHKGSATDTEAGQDESHLHVRLSSVAIVLLHEDILTLSPETQRVTLSSLAQMSKLADMFFAKLGLFAASGYGKKDFETAKLVFLEACQLNHIRLLAAPVIAESDMKRSAGASVMGSVLTVACVELLECLVEKAAASAPPTVEYIELVKFEQPSSAQDSPYQVSARPDVRVQVKRTKQTGRPSLSQRTPPTQTNVNVLLHNCCLEVDLSIVDRISAVLSCQPLCARSNDLPATGHFDLTGICLPDHSYQTHSRTDIKISSPLVIFKLRFPIPDLRPLYDMDRPPWWKRNVRKDILLAHLEQVSFTTAVDTKIAYSSYEMLSSQLTLLFQEGDTDIQVPIGVAQSDDKASQAGGLLRLSVQINPKACLEGMEDDESAAAELPLSASMTQSVYVDSKRKEPSPFSSKKVVHESDTTHTNTDTSSQFEGEELVVPGDREEMKLFIDTASRNTKTQVEINLPKANLHFPSKHLYEVFYNRLSTDLSLWVPSPQVVSGPIGSPAVSAFSPPAFTMCKSAVQCESESDSDTSENVYYSVWDSKPAVARAESDPGGQSKLTVTLTVGQGTLSVVTDLKGSSVEPTGHGHLGLRFQEANLFTVSGYKGTPLHNYICAQVNNFSLLHNGEVTEPLFNLHSFGGGGATGGLLDEVIYKTESGARVRPGGGVAVGVGSDRSADMLTIAMTSRVDESRVKMVRLACGVRGATLRHRVTPSSHSWLMQLIGFFDVMDYPVAGYQPSQAITELHQHLWDCSVDYRPVHLPLRSLLAVASLSVSSNMAARTSSSTLRFIAEDAFIFISDKLLPSVELRLDYVCVVDLGLFELSVRTSDSSPRVDLRASNNVLRIRTCSDSARLLTQLIGYLAAYGDLAETTNLPDGPPPDAADPDPTETLSRSTVQRVNSLMEEAMVDHFKDTKSKAGSGQRAPGVEVFFFPGEVVPDGVEAADVSPPPLDSSDADSVEFVMVEHEAGSGYMSGASQGMPEIRLLTIAPVTIIENHFSKPLGKTDFLKAPLNFPAPVYKYTLREMSVIWYMYGGLDFKPVVQAKKHVTICSESGSTPSSPLLKKHATVDVNYSKTCPQQVQFSDRPFSGGKPKTESSRQKSMWWTRGGLGRDHDLLMELQLNKVRFQHEVYPETTREASRQVLLIHEVDIRDRLAVSKINKFLYQYTSECRPKQSHANMVVVKATNLRPDPQLAVQECCLRVSLLPLRLNIDQDSLLFLITFANEIAGFIDKEDDSEALVPVSPRHVPPVMTVDSEPPPAATEDDSTLALDDHPKHQTSSEDVTTATPIFFRRFEFTPEVPIRLDYEGKHVDMKHGPLAGLLMGLAQLNCSELRLKRLSHRHGLLGFEKLLSFVMSEWLGDIKKNQLPSLLGGVGPMYSVVQLFQGIRDLFWLPIEQYQKDGRIVRGLQRGANSFTTCTAMAALELTTRIVHAIQCVAETAFDMVSPGPSVRRRKHRRGKQPRSRHTPPADFREGVSNAMALVKEGIGETAHTLVQEAMAEHEDKGAIGAVGVVLRQIPPACVTPLILASAATSNLLGGVRSQLVPDVRREAALKWRDDQPPQPPHHRH